MEVKPNKQVGKQVNVAERSKSKSKISRNGNRIELLAAWATTLSEMEINEVWIRLFQKVQAKLKYKSMI